nr:MAG TPA: hypothetical protein [Bacteriophage sp.]
MHSAFTFTGYGRLINNSIVTTNHHFQKLLQT